MTSVVTQNASLDDVVPELHCMRFWLATLVTGVLILLLLIHAMWVDSVFRLPGCDAVSSAVCMLLVFGVPAYPALLLGCLATMTWSLGWESSTKMALKY